MMESKVTPLFIKWRFQDKEIVTDTEWRLTQLHTPTITQQSEARRE